MIKQAYNTTTCIPLSTSTAHISGADPEIVQGGEGGVEEAKEIGCLR